jgi:Tol biopolymer transport system component
VGKGQNAQSVASLADSVKNAVLQYIDLVNNYLAQYAQYNQADDFVFDQGLYTLVPQLHWQAAATTPELYDLNTFPVSSTVVAQQTGQVGWRSSATESGTVKLWLMPSNSDDARLIDSFLGAECLGGAFGPDMPASDTVEIAVGDFIVTVSADECMHDGDTGRLEVLVGDAFGASFVPQSGVDVTVDILGGAATGALTTVTGQTDAEGKLGFTYTADPTVSEVRFTGTATHPTTSASVVKTFVTKVQDHCSLAIDLSILDCLQQDQEAQVTITAGEPNASGGLDGYAGIDLTFSMQRGEINNGIGIGTTGALGQLTVPVVPASNTGNMDLNITAADSEGLYAEKLFTIPILADCAASGEILFWRLDRGAVGSDYELYAVAPDGSGLERVVDPLSITESTGADLSDTLSYSPQQGAVVFSVFKTGSGNEMDIYRVNRDGSGLVLLTPMQVEATRNTQPRWSPDGTRIAFLQEGPSRTRWDLAVVPAAGGTVTVLDQNGSPLLNPTWSPDGVWLAYVGDDDAIWKVASAGGTPVLLAAPPAGEVFRYVVWSPDGSQLAFIGSNAGSGQSWVYTVAAGGTDLQRRTSGNPAPDRGLAWSPNGQRLAFRADGTAYNLYVMGGDGSGLMSVASRAGWFAWSPGGTQLVYAGVGGLHIASLDGSPSVRVTDVPAAISDEKPLWVEP